jgi:hypothetical protein
MLVTDAVTLERPADVALPAWSPATRVAFRFAFSVALLSAVHFLGFIPSYVQPASLKAKVSGWIEPVGRVESLATNAIGMRVIRLAAGGTGDEISRRYPYPFRYAISVTSVAVAMTLLWTALDRRRRSYPGLNRWLRLYARYALLTVTMAYAVVKVIPTQFGFLTPGELLKPVGQLNRFWMLWNFMVVSTGYTIFAGLVELLGCVLLIFRRTTLLGALLLAAAMTNVLAMDLAYRVYGAGVIAGLLLVLAAIVIAPYARALADVFLLGRAGRLPDEPSTPLSRLRVAPGIKVTFLALLVGLHIPDALAERRTYFGQGRGVFGLFEVERFERAGAVVTPLASDGATWKRVGTDGRYDSSGVTVQFANSDVRQYQLVEDIVKHQWTLRLAGKDAATLRYILAADGNLSLDGQIGDAPVRMQLRRIDVSTLPLLRR